MSAWKTLAEVAGIEEARPNWARVQRQRAMQTHGTMDRRNKQGPMAYFNPSGTGMAQRDDSAANAEPRMTPKPGGLQIPSGTDRPSQPNPLYAPPPRRSPLSTGPNSPQALDPDDEDI